MRTRLNGIALVAGLAGVWIAGCMAPQAPQEGATDGTTVVQTEALANRNGFSGLAQVDESRYLAVHDDLIFEDGSRLTLIRMGDAGVPTLAPVAVDDWVDFEGRPSDLESVCAIPSRSKEFILVEAGYWQGQYGRLFHIELDARENRAKVLGVSKLPLFVDNSPDHTGDQFEGLECADGGHNAVLLILGERGGSDSYESGRLRWGTLQLTDYSLTFTVDGKRGIEIEAPGQWTDAARNRDISALYLDDDGTLWAAATEDPGDVGPFYSVIYQVGSVDPDLDYPIQAGGTISAWKVVPGFKVEALAAPVAAVAGSTLSFGTEDEVYGGVWRVL